MPPVLFSRPSTFFFFPLIYIRSVSFFDGSSKPLVWICQYRRLVMSKRFHPSVYRYFPRGVPLTLNAHSVWVFIEGSPY